MNIPLKVKRIGSIFAGLFLSLCCFFGSYLFLNDAKLRYSKVITGKILGKSIKQNPLNVRGGIKIAKKAFYIKIEGFEKTLKLYRMDQTYQRFDEELNLNDTVKVYYNEINPANIEVDIIQIEHGNQIIISRKDFSKKSRRGAYVAFLGGFVLIVVTFFEDKKYRRKIKQININK